MNLLALPAEQVIIGCCLQGRILLDRVEGLRPEHFAGESHREAFAAILASWAQGLPADPVRLDDLLRAKGNPPAGLAYWCQCADAGFSAALLPGHVRTVREMADRRALLAAAGRIAELAQQGGDIREQIAEAVTTVSNLGQTENGRGLRAMSDVVRDFLPEFGKRFEPQQDGITTGFADLDAKLHRLRPGNLVLIAARPAMGKTAFAMQLALHEARQGGAVAVFSQEMADTELAARLFAIEGRIELGRLNAGELSSEEHDRFGLAVQRLEQLPLFIDDQPAQRLADIRARVQRLRQRQRVTLVVVDYLQLMEGAPSRSSSNRNAEIEQISRGLKALAKELACPVIALSQLNRDLERRPNKRPVLSDLRDSGAIEQDADVVLMLYRDEAYNPDTPDKGVAEILIRKHRQGATGDVRLTWLGHFTAFANYAGPVAGLADHAPPRYGRGFDDD